MPTSGEITPSDLIQIGIATISLVGVIAAWATAYLNWKSRPFLLATREKHTRDLSAFFEMMKQEIQSVHMSNDTPYEGYSIETETRLSFEEKPLFKDLKNHIPKQITLLGDLDKFKIERKKTEELRVSLRSDIIKYIENRSGLKVLNYEETNRESSQGVTVNCVDWLYKNILWKARGSTLSAPRYEIVNNDNEMRANGSTWSRTPQSLYFSSFIETILHNIQIGNKETADYALLATAQKIVQTQADMEQVKQNVLNQIDEAEAIPIFPGECKHLERANDKLNQEIELRDRSELRIFFDNTALGVTFLALSVMIISSIDFTKGISFKNLVLSTSGFQIVLAGLGFILFILFSLSLLDKRLTSWYSTIFEKKSFWSSFFLPVLWGAIILGFFAALFSESIKLPEFLRTPAVWLTIIWLAWVIIAVIKLMIFSFIKKHKRKS